MYLLEIHDAAITTSYFCVFFKPEKKGQKIAPNSELFENRIVNLNQENPLNSYFQLEFSQEPNLILNCNSRFAATVNLTVI